MDKGVGGRAFFCYPKEVMKTILCLLFVVFLSGCAKLSNLQELLTLKDLSEDQDRQVKVIERQEGNFQKILKAVEKNDLAQYPGVEEFRNAFGEPVLMQEVRRNGVPLQQWMYCHPTDVLKSSRVYVYFDEDGKRLDWKFVESIGDKAEIRP